MRMKIGLMIVLFLSTPVFAREGSGVKGGGMMYCAAASPAGSSAFPYEGYYSTDYIQALESNRFEIDAGDTYREALGKIATRLEALNPLENSLSDSLKKFTANLLSNAVNPERDEDLEPGRVWAPSFVEPQPLNNRWIKKIPPNCHGFYQAILREEANHVITYTYYAPLIEKLENDPSPFVQMQLSYLFLHEWLRDYLVDMDSIYEANLYLHGLINHPESRMDMRIRLLSHGMKELVVKSPDKLSPLVIDLIKRGFVPDDYGLIGYFEWIHQSADGDATPYEFPACVAPPMNGFDRASNKPFTDPGCKVRCQLTETPHCAKGRWEINSAPYWVQSSCSCSAD